MIRRNSGNLLIELSIMERRALWRQFLKFQFTIKSGVQLLVEPPMTVDLYFCSDADTCFFPFFLVSYFLGTARC